MDEHDAPARAIDLNADLGEAAGDDEAMLDVVTSANIACGFHAGDPATMWHTVQAAVARRIAIGAHVGYPDLAGFGRRAMDMASGDLTAAVLYQLGALDGLCRAAGSRVRYVKPHGALYNRIVHDEVQAGAVLDAVASYHGTGHDAPLAVMGLPGSAALHLAAARGLPTIAEAFADRAYASDATLVPRSEPGAVLSDPVQVAARAVGMVRQGSTVAITGEQVVIEARSLCLHGDSPGAVEMARAVRAALDAAGIELAPFVDPAG